MLNQGSLARSICDAPAERISVVHLVIALNRGGLEKVVYDLTRLANRGRFDVRVLCLGEVGALGSDFEAEGIIVESLGVDGQGTWRCVRAVARRLKELRPHVLHTHNPKPHLVGAIAAWLARVPVVVHTKHGRNYPDEPRKVLANRLATILTNRIVAVSRDAADVSIDTERIRPDKLLVVKNGIDLERFIVRRRPATSTFIRAVHVARLDDPAKDQTTLLQATRLVADCERHFNVDIIGDGPSRRDLEQLAESLDLRGCVTFHGFRDDIAHAVSQADFFVLSSVTEGLSITLLEAAACGLPIVATDVGGNSEVVEDQKTGFLVPAKNPQAMADAMVTMIRNPERAREMGAAGRRRVEEHFDLRKVVVAYETLYEECCRRGRSPLVRNINTEAIT